mmetsp:Transcript_7278/g.13603  ORF Transcript_7278/g.13603 Transcript_7278/m.13603 type:complete len:318 (-) Transcript_7278:210-1163(-)|eukprot:CAMPEP_0197523216 /NCGR_PEP_ID=MMETSP1318-20131121/8193_1 /TAXON_ID=552666 /ORGANISM="Partenskyella glossopodia, Strain RCC365" /LENGTH=317 /DNA_ID=CAMNT_0043075839 /DNA_START=99 /DNA_END=1052 /DNA_ORIENTATION=-
MDFLTPVSFGPTGAPSLKSSSSSSSLKPNKRQQSAPGFLEGMSREAKLPYFASAGPSSGSGSISGSGAGGLSIPGLGLRSMFSSCPPVIDPSSHRFVQRRSGSPVYRSIGFVGEQNSHESRSVSFDEEPRVVPRTLPPFYEKNTSFACGRSCADIWRALQSALSIYSVEAKPSKGKFKGTAMMMGQKLVFQVHVFVVEADKSHVVEFQRRSGDSCAFCWFFRDTMETLSGELADAAAFVDARSGGQGKRFEVIRSMWKSNAKDHTRHVDLDIDIGQVTDALSKGMVMKLADENKKDDDSFHSPLYSLQSSNSRMDIY